MSSGTATFFWMKYGFDHVTPPKMYNANVSCAILQSFVKNTCAREIEDMCKQKSIQLSIELDAINRMLQASGRSTPALKAAGSRPPSGATSSRPITPTVHAAVDDDEITEALAKKAATEVQLEVVAAASKLAKELAAGTAIVDLADEHNTRLKLDEANDAKANTLVKPRAHYTAVAVTTNERGAHHVTPLLFKLQKFTPEEPAAEMASRPSSAAMHTTIPTAS